MALKRSKLTDTPPASNTEDAQLPLSEAEASLFREIRMEALKVARDFLKLDITDETEDATKLRMKKAEVAMQSLSLTGRVDPGKLREQQTDEVAELLEQAKAG